MYTAMDPFICFSQAMPTEDSLSVGDDDGARRKFHTLSHVASKGQPFIGVDTDWSFISQ